MALGSPRDTASLLTLMSRAGTVIEGWGGLLPQGHVVTLVAKIQPGSPRKRAWADHPIVHAVAVPIPTRFQQAAGAPGTGLLHPASTFTDPRRGKK